MSKNSGEIRDKIALVLRIVAIVLYIFAIVSFVLGFVHIVDESMLNFGDDIYDLDRFDERFDGFGEILNSSMSYMFNAFVCMICGSVLLILSNSHKFRAKRDRLEERQVLEQIQNKEKEYKTNETQQKNYKIVCAYCGTELDEEDKKCPNCGASKKIQKKLN